MGQSIESILLKMGFDYGAVEKGLANMKRLEREAASEYASIWENADVKRMASQERTNAKMAESKKGLFEGAGEVGKMAAGYFGIEAVEATISRANAISNMAAQTGMTAENIQRIDLAFKEMGISVETGNSAIEKLNVNVGKAREGSDEAQKAFEKWGIEISGKDNAEIIAEISDKMHGMTDPAERAAMAVELMGKSGRELVPLLMKGADAMKEMGEHGPIMSKDDLDAIKLLHESLNTFVNYLEVGLGRVFGWVAKIAQFMGRLSTGSLEGNNFNYNPDGSQKKPEDAAKKAALVVSESSKKIATEERAAKDEERRKDKAAKDTEKEDRKSERAVEKAAHDAERAAQKQDRLNTQATQLNQRIGQNLEKMAQEEAVYPSIENLAGRNWTKKFSAQYEKGGRYDLGRGDGYLKDTAREYERAKYQQQYDRTYGNLGAAENDRQRMVTARDTLIRNGAATPQMTMEKMEQNTANMAGHLQRLLAGGAVIKTEIQDAQ